jgi:amino acid transporter
MATQGHAAAGGLERRVVGLPTAIGTTFSLIVAASVLATVAGGFSASWVWLIALGIALFTMFLQSMSFSELATMIPKAGSMNEYVRAGLGPFFATMTVLVGYIAIQLFPGSAEAYSAGIVTSDVLGAGLGFKEWVWIFVGFLAIVNIAGIRPFAALEVFLTFAVALSLLVLGIVGLAGAGSNDPISSAFPDIPDFSWGNVFDDAGNFVFPGLATLLGIAIFTFVGVEYTCPLAEELKRPARDIPWGIFVGLGLIAVPIVLYGLAATRYVDPGTLSTFAPTLHIDVGVAIFGEAGKWWLGLVSIAATLGTLNAVLAGVPRILYGMALTRQLPSFFGYLLPATRAPVVGVVLLALMAILMNQFGATERGNFIELILAGVLGWATAYGLIHLSQIALRMREPGASRPYRSPFFPLPQLVGMGLLALAGWKIFPVEEIQDGAYEKFGYFIAGAVVFSLVFNLLAFKSLATIFKPVALREVYEETEEISEHLPLEVEPGGPHLPHRE